MSEHDRYRFEYDPATIRFGTGAVGDLADELDAHGFERALVVCGRTVGSTPDVIDPVTDGLGDRLAGVFAETTPEKRLSTAYDGLEAARERDADALVSLGGGSSLDVAKVIATLSADDRDPGAVGRELAERGTIATPDASPLPIVAVPTTLAGADLSIGAGLSAAPESGLVDEDAVDGDAASGGISDPRLMPAAAVYDPALVATTPESILAGSAMNGFDKGIETLYARNATPVTDATAARGLALLAPGLRKLGSEGVAEETIEPVLEGTVLVQYGISRPRGTTLSIVHAFGHALRRVYGLQQGIAHAVVVPHVLRYLFEEVDGRRDLLADALGVADEPDPAEAVVAAVADVRDALGLPARLGDLEAVDPDAFPAVAAATVEDPFMQNAPAGLEATREELEGVLYEAYK